MSRTTLALLILIMAGAFVWVAWRANSVGVLAVALLYLINAATMHQRYSAAREPEKRALKQLWMGLSLCIIFLLGIIRHHW